MSFSINQFKAAVGQGGTRNNLFEVRLTNPATQVADLNFPFLCKAASLPSSTIAAIPLHYFGRAINLAGNRTFDPWTVTIINDENFQVRNAMETWSNFINGFEQNIRQFPASDASLYKTTADVVQFSQTGDELRTYKMVGMFPTSISAIPLDWDADNIEQFEVQFQIDYWFVAASATADLAGGV